LTANALWVEGGLTEKLFEPVPIVTDCPDASAV
jgi:hypothetical protein